MVDIVASIHLDTRELDRITKELKPRAQRILKAAAAEISGKAKIMAPVDTGALRNSIDFRQVDEFTWWVEDGVEYGIYVELPGITRHWAGHPFMTPAVEWTRPHFDERWKELFE
jgi:hypothetical protein